MSTTPRILYSDLSKVTYSHVSGSTDTNAPLLNLKTWFTTDYWQSSTTGSMQSLVMDFGTAAARNFVLIHGHNIESVLVTGSILLQAADNPTFTSGLTTVLAINQTLDSFQEQSIIYNEFPAVSKRFWRILYSGSIQEPPRAATVLVDRRLDFQFTQKWDYAVENQRFETVSKVALDGTQLSAQAIAGRLVYELQFPQQNDTFKTDFHTFQTTVRGRLGSFYFYGHDGTIRLMKLESDYSPVQVDRFAQNSINKIMMKSLETKDLWYTDSISTADGLSGDDFLMDY